MQSRTGYSAAGRYQIVRATLQSLIDSDWKMTDLFSAETQDLLALNLLRRRGWDRWLAGRLRGGDDAFAQRRHQHQDRADAGEDQQEEEGGGGEPVERDHLSRRR
jgi:hypothetical protein